MLVRSPSRVKNTGHFTNKPFRGISLFHRPFLPRPNAAFLTCLLHCVVHPKVIIFNEKMPAGATAGHLLPSRQGRKRITLSQAEGFYYHVVNEQWHLSIQRDSEGPGEEAAAGEAGE